MDEDPFAIRLIRLVDKLDGEHHGSAEFRDMGSGHVNIFFEDGFCAAKAFLWDTGSVGGRVAIEESAVIN